MSSFIYARGQNNIKYSTDKKKEKKINYRHEL